MNKYDTHAPVAAWTAELRRERRVRKLADATFAAVLAAGAVLLAWMSFQVASFHLG